MQRTPHFYIQPKIQKEGNPGRPVVNSFIYNTPKISEHADFHPQTIIKQIPSYLKDTTDVLHKLDAIKFTPSNAYLVFADVQSL